MIAQFVGLLVITLGLTKVLFDDRRSEAHEFNRFRSTLKALAVAVGLGFAFWCSATVYYLPLQLTLQSVAIVPISLVSFWSVTHRGSVAMRMAVFLALLVVLALLLGEPIGRYSPSQMGKGEIWFSGLALSRLIVGIGAGMVAGVYCRVLGWRIEIRDEENQKSDASTRDIWILILGIVLSVPLLQQLQAFSQHQFSGLFDTDFALARMACFYAACILAFLSIMICRFTNQWLVAACVIISGLSIQIVLREGLYGKLGFLELADNKAYSWYQFTPLFILIWWLASLLLRYLGVALQKTNELLLFQLQLKHFVVATGVVCLLVANVKSQYVSQFAKNVQQDLRQVGGDATLRGNDIISLSIHADGVPEILLKSLARLQLLESAKIYGSTLDQELFDLLSHCPKLKTLEIIACRDSLTNSTSLSGFQHLERLSVADTNLSATQFSQLVSESPISYLAISVLSLTRSLPMKFLQHLDLSAVSPQSGIDDLLGIDAQKLHTVTFPMRYNSDELYGFESVPLNLPNLQKLQLKCGDLTPEIVADINELNLSQLELLGCQSGYERIVDLNVDSIRVIAEFDEQSLLTLIAEPKVMQLHGSAKEATIRASASRLFAAYQDRRLTFDLASSENVASISTIDQIPNQMVVSMGLGGFGSSPLLMHHRNTKQQPHVARRMLLIGENGEVSVSRMPLSLDEFVQLLAVGQDIIQIQSPVYDGDRLLLKRFAVRQGQNSLTQLFDITDSSWEKLSAVLDSHTPIYLVRPSLSTDSWRNVAEWPGALRLEWESLPRDYRSILAELSDRIVVVSVRNRLSDEQMAEFQKYPKIEVSNYYIR